MALMMAAVAPLRLEARSVNIEYSTPGHPVDVKVEREYTTAVSNTNQTSKQVGDLERQIRREEEMEVDNVNKDYAREAVLTPPRRRGKESDMVEEDLSEQEQSSDDEPSDESNSDTETPSKTNWEKQYSASVAASIDVAGRDNCVLVFHSLWKRVRKAESDAGFAERMRIMTQMKSMKSIWHVQCVEIIVSCELVFTSRILIWCVRYVTGG